jgi:arsenate reductase
MAEGLLNALYGAKYEASSAGLEPSAVNPYAIEVMEEIGIDISEQYPKSIDQFREEDFDYVVTVCDHAKEACPFFPAERVLHKGFDDPSESRGSEEEILAKVRRVRDAIKDWISQTFG